MYGDDSCSWTISTLAWTLTLFMLAFSLMGNVALILRLHFGFSASTLEVEELGTFGPDNFYPEGNIILTQKFFESTLLMSVKL